MNQQLQIIDHNNQRVLTTAQLAEAYGTETKLISKNFERNEARYKEGKHYHALAGEELKRFKASRQIDGNLKFAPVMYLWTEKGAWLHAKSLNTDEAWNAYEMLVDDYYEVKTEQKKLSAELQAIFVLDQRSQEFDTRITKIENNTTIDYGQQRTLSKLGNATAIRILGGKDSAAYQNKSLRGKVYSQLWNNYKDYFQVNSYANTLIKDYDQAREYINGWSLFDGLLREVEEANKQLVF
jgi:hypothetical protein